MPLDGMPLHTDLPTPSCIVTIFWRELAAGGDNRLPSMVEDGR